MLHIAYRPNHFCLNITYSRPANMFDSLLHYRSQNCDFSYSLPWEKRISCCCYGCTPHVTCVIISYYYEHNTQILNVLILQSFVLPVQNIPLIHDTQEDAENKDTWHHITGDSNLHSQCHESLNSHIHCWYSDFRKYVSKPCCTNRKYLLHL